VIRREVGYTWRLRQVMAAHGLFSTTDLQPLLVERGVELSAAQVYRLVTSPPERLNMQVLAAVCDALGCTPNDLIEPTATDTTIRAPRARRGRTTAEPASEAPPLDRPTRVQIVPPA
jgi:DNA-binding Xre family transcriptional regulator